MKQPLQLSVPQPCHEDWHAMTPQQQGRFCNSCQKTVVDFTSMSDRQVLDYFAHTAGNVCGRFCSDQLNRNLSVPAVSSSKTGWKWLMAAVASLSLVSRKVQAQVQSQETSVEQMTVKGDTILQGVQSAKAIIIKGRVTDKRKKPVEGASVMVNSKGTVTDSNGNFLVSYRDIPSSKSQLTISALGFERYELSLNSGSNNLEINVQLKDDEIGNITTGIVVVGYTKKSKKQPSKHPSDSVWSFKNIFSREQVSVYPNPCKAGQTLHIVIKDTGNWHLELFDLQSKLYHTHNVKQHDGKQAIDVTLPANIPTGMYYIKVSNVFTRKQFIMQVIVE